MAARTANALWEGSIQDGQGRMSLGSGAFEGAYSFQSRFGEGETGTTPEELIAAANAGCFSMALSLALGDAGHAPESIQTTANVTMRNIEGQPTITKIALATRARVPGLDDGEFQKVAEEVKAGCIVSRALAAVDEITLDATLEN